MTELLIRAIRCKTYVPAIKEKQKSFAFKNRIQEKFFFMGFMGYHNLTNTQNEPYQIILEKVKNLQFLEIKLYLNLKNKSFCRRDWPHCIR